MKMPIGHKALSAGCLLAAALLSSHSYAPAAVRQPRAPRYLSGMTLEIRDARVVVGRVLPGSPAAQAGLLQGDMILVVNDTRIIDLDVVSPEVVFDLFDRLLERPGAARVRLVVGRGGGTMSVNLPLIRTSEPAGTNVAVEPALVGRPAPLFSGRDLEDREVELAALRGRPVLLDFWASWCPPCSDAAITLRRLSDQYGDRLTIVGVSLDEDPRAFEAFVYNHHLPGHQIHDGGPSGPIGQMYDVASVGIPYSILISPTGRIVSMSSSLSSHEKAIEELVAGGSNEDGS